jgi:hypothetical protein
VGFGDVTAKSETARIVLIVQMLADLAVLGAGVRVLLGGGAARPGTTTGDVQQDREDQQGRVGPFVT